MSESPTDNVRISLVDSAGYTLPPKLCARLANGGSGLLITDLAHRTPYFYRLYREADGLLKFVSLEESPDE